MSIETFYWDIEEFHETFAIDYKGPVRPLEEDLADFRMRCQIEEAEEVYGANMSLIGAYTPEDIREAKAELLDGFVDSLYFMLGSLYLHGFKPEQFDEAWQRVHSKNLTKIRAQPDGSDSKRNHGSDVVKPAGWTPADLTDLV